MKRDFTNIVNLFHAYVWLAGQSNKVFDEKSWDPPNLLHSQKWMQQSILWIYFMPLYGWKNNELLIKNHKTCPNWFYSIPRSECSNIWFIFSWSIMILILDMVIKKISKTHFVTRSGTIMWKKEKENVKIMTKRLRYILSLRW